MRVLSSLQGAQSQDRERVPRSESERIRRSLILVRDQAQRLGYLLKTRNQILPENGRGTIAIIY